MAKNLKKIAICGKQNTGKNTLATVLTEVLCANKYEYEIKAFADPIKEMICLMFPKANPKYLWGSSNLRNNIIPNAYDKNGKPLTYRQALIDIGTLGRQYNKDVWVNAFDDRVKKIIGWRQMDNYEEPLKIVDIKLLICSDVRFINEYVYLKDKGFFIIKVVRDTIIHSKDATETEQDGINDNQFDYILQNNGTIEAFKEQAVMVAGRATKH